MKIIRPVNVADSTLTSSTILENDYAAHSVSTVYAAGDFIMEVDTNVHKIYQSLVGVRATVTLTIASPCVVTFSGTIPAADTPVVFTTTGALPTGVLPGTVYYVKSPTTTGFNISATVGGANINTSGSQSGVHTAVASANYNKDITNTTYWIDAGATNRWRMFDSSITSQTSASDEIEVVFDLGERVDTITLLNISAKSARVVVEDAVDGVVYDSTANLISSGGITDLYLYFFEPVERVADFVFEDLPPYANPTITITLEDPSNTVLCGGCVLGLSRDFSDDGMGVERGAKTGIQDYSIKQRDTFGNYTILERAFNKRADFTVYVPSDLTEALQTTLSRYRATPIVYIGHVEHKTTIIYGFYKDFSIEIAYPTFSVCTISLEGLT
jgi:hypothetical protein